MKMPVHSQDGKSRAARFASALALIALALLALGAAAAAQTPQAGAPPAPSAPVAAPPPAATPPLAGTSGWIGTFGSWMQRGVTTMGAGFDAMMGAIRGGAGQAAKGAADAASTAAGTASSIARDAADTVKRLPTTGIIAGRERCTLAPNGAPDCRLAAEALCRSGGYGGGTSVDFETAEKCPPVPPAIDRTQLACTREHFGTRALCQ
jgi:hypothetical protein